MISPTAQPRTVAQHEARGFTLLELIIALAMVAVIAGSLFTAVKVSYRAQQSAESAVETSRVADLAFQLIRADLENAVPPGVLAQPMLGTNSSNGTGDADELTIYTTASAPDQDSTNGDIKEVNLIVGTPENSTIQDQCLLRRVNRNLLATNTEIYHEQILCRNVTGFNIRYYDGTDWQDDFDGSTQSSNPLPAAAEVTLEFEINGVKKRYVRVFKILCSTLSVESSQ